MTHGKMNENMTTAKCGAIHHTFLATFYQLDGSEHFWWAICVCIVLTSLIFMSSATPLLLFRCCFCQNSTFQIFFFFVSSFFLSYLLCFVSLHLLLAVRQLQASTSKGLSESDLCALYFRVSA